MIHEITLKGYGYTMLKTLELGTAESYGIEQLRIIRADDWQGMAINAYFHNGDTAIKIVADGDLIAVPAEITAKPTHNGVIVVEGLAEGKRAYTINIKFAVRDHAEATGDNATPPTPTDVEQITMAANRAVSIAEGVQAAAERGEFNGKPGAPGKSAFSPYVGATGNWFVYSDATQKYIDTGVRAQGDDGAPGGYYYPTIINGVLYWAKSDPSMPDAPAAVVKGEDGKLTPEQEEKLNAAATKQYVDNAVGEKQDKLLPGGNIKIEGNVISSTAGGLTPEQEAKLDAAATTTYVNTAISDAIATVEQIADDILEVL